MLTGGYVTTATTQSVKHQGIILQSVASTDADFASNTKVLVECPAEQSAEFEADVSGTLAITSVGSKFDLSDASTVNQAGTTYQVVTCTGFISSSKGRFALNTYNNIVDKSNE